MMREGGLRLELIAREEVDGLAALEELDEAMGEHNVYRGRVLAFDRDEEGAVSIAVRRLPEVPRDAIVLPDGVLERIERQALAPARHRERLLAAGRHLKRGLLLHGPPGTGKTLSIMHVASRLSGHTILLLTGGAFGLIEPAARLARELQPAVVVLEDVDLVAHERMFDDDYAPLLFSLLNEMDGLADDADVLFVLTTNRADVLEPALAARPGRIDQAVELPLPDATARRRLIELYARGLVLRAERLDEVVERLEGASPAHIKELLRKAALIAAEARDDDPLTVEDADLDEALEDLVIGTGDVRASLFDATPRRGRRPSPSRRGWSTTECRSRAAPSRA
jgi:ATP-dependent 26S proteasome regulatory subunit